MQHVDAKVGNGAAGITRLRPLLVWLLVAVVLMLAGCGGAPAAAGAPEDAAPTAVREAFPTSYPESVPASDEVVLKWNGTLVLPGEAHPIVRTSE